jgi:hypothetical protein
MADRLWTAIDFPNVSPLYGVLFVVLGLGFFIWTVRAEPRSGIRRTVIAIRHQSMEALTRSLSASTLPPELAGTDIHRIDVNQAAFYSGGVLKAPEAAVRLQMDLAGQVRTLLGTMPNAEIAYYGKAHIPLVFLAGYALSTDSPIRLYELDRQTGDWRAIEEAGGEDLGLRVDQGAGGDDTRDAVIRVSISYPVDAADVAEALPRPYRDVHLSIEAPNIDSIRTKHQIDTIARAFRRVLDQLKDARPQPKQIHIFYSGPMSLAFSLGRQISATIHPPVFVYNFSAKTTPKYSWALPVNADTSPDLLIAPVPPVAAGRS